MAMTSPSSGGCNTLAMVIVILGQACPSILIQKDRTLQQSVALQEDGTGLDADAALHFVYDRIQTPHGKTL
ncbi:hypothetical protein EYF80_008741 [Liparis tanakae]|uniref:Uncharacterized protein n=1 Tax=Liparis tanakae TaxID=230148 RepID=A0A4Z2IT53_9TELE|nr:hypothetical protein EYF80_008741 [Liparis tanakae]